MKTRKESTSVPGKGSRVRKGFRTSPSIRIPRAAAEKLQAAAAAAAAAENKTLLAALKDAVSLIDELNQQPLQPPPRLSGAQVKCLEAIRFLSLGV